MCKGVAIGSSVSNTSLNGWIEQTDQEVKDLSLRIGELECAKVRLESFAKEVIR